MTCLQVQNILYLRRLPLVFSVFQGDAAELCGYAASWQARIASQMFWEPHDRRGTELARQEQGQVRTVEILFLSLSHVHVEIDCVCEGICKCVCEGICKCCEGICKCVIVFVDLL